MAVIEASGHLKGEAKTEVKAGLRISCSAQCHGMAYSGDPRDAQSQQEPVQQESLKTK